MPKEIAHWSLAAAMAKKLPRDSLFHKPVHSFFNLFLMGAISPDIPFYYLAGPKSAVIQHLSTSFHGRDERSLVPVLAFLDQNQDKDPAVLAFAAGVICHILADTLFHPLVYYFAGKEGIHSGATARHRQFETAMDLHFWHLYRPRVSLFQIFKGLEVSEKKFNRFLADLFQVRARPEKRYLGPALYFHMTLQYLFRSATAYKIFAFLGRKTPWISDKIIGLIYPCNGPVNLAFFSQKLLYKDPCTGTIFSTKISRMAEETAVAGAGLLSLISTALVQSRPGLGVLDCPDLPKIRPDLPRKGFFFWRGKYDLEADLYRGFDDGCQARDKIDKIGP